MWSKPLDRRSFLGAWASLVVAGPPARAAETAYSGEIVDTHVHLWDRSQLKLPWVDGATGRAREVLGRDFKVADYVAAARGLRITRGIYMEVDVAVEDQVKELEFVTDLCADGASPIRAGVVSGRPADPGFEDYLLRFRTNPCLKGVRQVLHTGATVPRFCLEPAFVNGIRLLGDRGLSFDLCLRNDQLEAGAELVDLCPGTRFVLDHCGNPHGGPADLAAWRRGLMKVAEARNRKVMCKISGLYGNVKVGEWPPDRLAPIVRTVIDAFGWDRVLFAGDWPVVNLGATLRLWVEALKWITRDDTPTNQAKLFRENALTFYGIK